MILLLALALPAWAFPPPPKAVPLKVDGNTITFVKSFPVTVTAPAGADFYIWSYPDGVKAFSADNVLTITAAPNGTHRINVISLTLKIDFEAKKVEKIKDTGTTEINVGAPEPPRPPDPPTPPVPVGALRVLIVFENTEAKTYPITQQSVLYGKTFRDALDAKTPLGPDGKTHEWRMWDKDVDASAERPVWGDLLKRERKSLPWLILAGETGGTYYEGPLPTTVTEAVALLDKYAPKSKATKKGGK